MTEAEITRAGELSSEQGDFRIWEVIIDLVNTTTGSAILEDTQDVVFPSGLFIDDVTVFAEVAATSGGSATLNIGLIRQDRSTTYDASAFLAAAPLADYNAVGKQKQYAIGVTGVGTKTGTVLANSGVLVADWDTAAFTAGRIRVLIRGHIPRPSPSN